MSTTERSQGAEANHQGSKLHEVIAHALEAAGFVLTPIDRCGPGAVREIQSVCGNNLFSGNPVFAAYPVLCIGPFRENYRANFLLHAPAWPEPLALEAIHQRTSGSARDKIFKTAFTVKSRFPCPCLWVLDGPELAESEEVMACAHELADWSCGAVRRVFQGFYEFRQWLHAGYPFPQHQGDPLL